VLIGIEVNAVMRACGDHPARIEELALHFRGDRRIGVDGSLGARRIARITAARPCPECQALFWCTD